MTSSQDIGRLSAQLSAAERLDEKEISPVQTAPPPSRPSRTTLDASSDISYVYLTFDRTVPAAHLESQSGQPPPPPPDLSAYINPILYPTYRKNVLLLLSCIAAFLTAYTAGSYSPIIPLLRADLHAGSDLAVTVGVTTFCMGFGLAPMVLAPFSELNGRYPVFVVAGVIYVAFQVACGLVTNLAGILVARFLVGAGASVFSTMVGGVITDLYDKRDRNTPMALFSGSVLVGTGAGPLVCSVIAHRLAGSAGSGAAAPFKWVFWHQAIAGGVLMVLFVVFFHETRASVLLSRKAKALNRWYDQLERAGYYGVWVEEDARASSSPPPPPPPPGESNPTLSDQSTQFGVASDEEKGPSSSSRRASSVVSLRLQRVRWLVKEDEERSSLSKMISISLYRPFHLLFTEPVVFFFSLWVSFAWGVLYLTFGSIPLVFARQYGWNIEQAGRIFAAMVIGAMLGTAVGIWAEYALRHPRWHPTSSHPGRFWTLLRTHFPATAPEARLYFTCATAVLLPAGLFIFGFTARTDIPWPPAAVGIGLAMMGIYSVYLATFNYLADTYHRYASSALAAQSFCRNLLGGVFPLITPYLFTNLGDARAGATLGGIAVALTAVPWVLVFYGESIRARSRFASELVRG